MDTSVSFGLADFVSGGPILDLPVMEGATWNVQLNRPDAISCSIDMRDPDALKLDLRSSTEPMKTVIVAYNADDVMLAWGLIPEEGGRTWNNDDKTLDLVATGVQSSYFGSTVIAPASVLTAPLTIIGPDGYPIVNPTLDTTLSGWSHGTIGKKLIQQRLAFPGAPTVFDLPPDEPGTREQTYLLGSMKTIGAALDDLTKQEGGPDFAFDAVRASNGLGLRYVVRHGSEAKPRLGTDVGSWNIGGPKSPITGLKISDAAAAGASLGLMTSGKQGGAALVSRVRNTALVASGYPPFDIVDTSRSDVTVQATLDGYNRENMADAEHTIFDLDFSVEGDASPSIGQYRPGDIVNLDPPDKHPWITDSIRIRIMSVSGDETGKKLKIGCVILDDPA